MPYESDEVTRVVVDGLDAPRLRPGARLDRRRSCASGSSTTAPPARRSPQVSPGLTPEMVAAVRQADVQHGPGARRPEDARGGALQRHPGPQGPHLQPPAAQPPDRRRRGRARRGEGRALASATATRSSASTRPPATSQGTVDILTAVKDLMRRFRVPTQNCVLSHLTIQMAALQRGAPLDLMFQSIAGSEGANRNFGVSRGAARRGLRPGPPRGHRRRARTSCTSRPARAPRSRPTRTTTPTR